MKTFRSILWTGLVLLIFSCGNEGKMTKSDKRKILRFESSVQQIMKDLKLPGMSVVILKDQKILWKKGFGFANRRMQERVTPSTPFQLASVTKPIAAIIIMQLVENGQLNLDDPISKYDPALDTTGLVTIRHLISHTSESNPPGQVYNYNGNLYAYTGVPIKLITDKSYLSLAKENILGPLKMENTFSNLMDPEIMDRFLDFQEQKGKKREILSHKGNSLPVTNLYKYRNRGYWNTYEGVHYLLANAMDSTGTDSSNFHIYRFSGQLHPDIIQDFTQYCLQERKKQFEHFNSMAKPYELDENNNIVPGKYSMYFSTAAGFNSTVEDLAKFDIALDNNLFIKPETKKRMWTAMKTATGEVLPYGLGWFVQDYHGTELIWHYGQWSSASALYLKIPSSNLTMIALSNSEMMSGAFLIGEGDAMKSAIAMEFYKIFELGEQGSIPWKRDPEKAVQAIVETENPALKQMLTDQMHVMGMMHQIMGNDAIYPALLSAGFKAGIFSVEADKDIVEAEAIAEIIKVGNSSEHEAAFTIESQKDIRIYGIGEAVNGDFFDFGWITGKESGDTVWSMSTSPVEPAGGHYKNVKSDEVIKLDPGDYILHFKSDDSHAWMVWNASPPESWFWGVKVMGINP